MLFTRNATRSDTLENTEGGKFTQDPTGWRLSGALPANHALCAGSKSSLNSALRQARRAVGAKKV